MVEIKVFNTGKSLLCYGMIGKHRLIVPGSDTGSGARMPLSAAQFAACAKEMAGACKRGRIRFEATDGKQTTSVDLAMVEAFFSKAGVAKIEAQPEPAKQFQDEAAHDLQEEIRKIAAEQGAPPPAPWMNPKAEDVFQT